MNQNQQKVSLKTSFFLLQQIENSSEDENLNNYEHQFSSPNFDLFWEVVRQAPTIFDIVSSNFSAEEGVLKTLSELKSTFGHLTPLLESMIPIGPKTEIDQITNLWKRAITLLRGLINIIIIDRPVEDQQNDTISNSTSATIDALQTTETNADDDDDNPVPEPENQSWIHSLVGVLEQLLEHMEALTLGSSGGNRFQPNVTRAVMEKIIENFNKIKN